MSKTIQSGTMLVQQAALLNSLGTQAEIYNGQWCSLGTQESAEFDGRLRAAGWSLFFMADELRTLVPLWGGQKAVRAGVKRLLAQISAQHFNCMQLSNILRERFLGIPFVSVVAHARHLQKGFQIDSFTQRASKINERKRR